LRRTHAPVEEMPPPARWPSVTVQLPVYNEPNVIARLIDAVSALEYAGELQIQVLDDSTDATTAIAAARVAVWQARGVRISHLRRTQRTGYKAGALAHGMTLSNGELFAVFDADFVPAPDFLVRLVPHFADERVGMVQARWEHLNGASSSLTRVQAIFLDAHFAVESAARNCAGLFFNFNGTAGIWRRAAIDDAGGWSSSTLTEDLDLSYRAQLAGWNFVFRSDVTVPAELPASLSGFQEQQYRWAKGSIQTARKVLMTVLRSDARKAVKAEALFHLTNNSAYVLTVMLAILLPPAMWIRGQDGLSPMLIVDALLFLTSTLSVLLFYVEGQYRAGRRLRVRDLLSVLPIGIGIAVRNSSAVITGMIENGGYFARTPKRGSASVDPCENRPPMPFVECVLTLYLLAATLLFSGTGYWSAMPFLALFLAGFGRVALGGIEEHLSHAESKTQSPPPVALVQRFPG
jgi:cellulose synthase/poly-beta-1,6-N-acetylglucosamine synthase-like glycosyltransferase